MILGPFPVKMSMWVNQNLPEIIIFLVVGSAAAAVNYFSGELIRITTGQFTLSIIVGFITGSVVSFLFNRKYTFKAANGDYKLQLLRFCAVAVATIFLAAVTGYLINFMVQQERVSHLLTIIVMTAVNYLGLKLFAFKK